MTRSAGPVRVRWYRSLRTRIAIAFTIGAVLLVGAIGIALDDAIGRAAIDALRTRAVDQVSSAAAVYDLTGIAPAGAQVGPAVLPSAMTRALGRDRVVTLWDGRTLQAGRLTRQGDELALRLPGASVAAERARVRDVLLRTAVPLVILATLGGWGIAQGLTGRLRRAAVRLAPAPGAEPSLVRGDEVDALVRRVEVLTGALEERIERERGFTSIVAHELRTPLTALSAASELLPAAPESALVRRQAVRLRNLVDDLLELARADHAQLDLEECDLGVLLRDALRDIPAAKLTVEPESTVMTDPVMLRRIVTNLAINALRHGAPPVLVRATGTTIEVIDGGPGFPAALLDAGPRRFARYGSTGGVGLGLTIVQSWSHRLGIVLELHNTRSGARATLTLPKDLSPRTRPISGDVAGAARTR